MADSLYRPEESKGIWVWLEHDGKALEGVSLQLLAKGRELADAAGEKLVGFLMGHQLDALSKETLKYGVDEVIVAEDKLLKTYTTDAYSDAATQVITDMKPNVLLLGATPDGRDLAGRLAVRLRTGLTADCTDLVMKKDDPCQMLGEVWGFGGGIAAMIAIPKHRPQMATVRPGVFEPAKAAPKKKASVKRCKVTIDAKKIRTKVLERKIEEGVDLTKSSAIVVGGRGTKGDFSPINELARLIGGEVGCTRVAVDQGWVKHERMVGQTGVVTRPKVAVVCGVSGAMQFTVGIAAADKVVSINSDPEAPIFECSDYCVTEDLFKILPPLIKELKSK
ncbi:MAG: electron transfer flavoprotein subunit alpha/FixB family protein [Elusimicrobiota bacterium]